MKVAVCVIVKNENLYIREWIEYYKNLGFANVILYDNNDSIGGDDVLSVIQDYVDSNFVIYHSYKDYKKIQSLCYDECYRNYYDKYDWIAYFDADEFLWINEKSINDLLSNPRYNGFNMVKVAWKMYNDNDKLYYEPGNVLDRFTNSLNQSIAQFLPNLKVILRTTIDPNDVIFIGPHFLKFNDKVIACNSDGICAPNIFAPLSYNFKNAYLKHIWCKSTEEFILKLKRGYPDQIMAEKKLTELIRIYCSINKMSDIKYKMIKEAFPTIDF